MPDRSLNSNVNENANEEASFSDLYGSVKIDDGKESNRTETFSSLFYNPLADHVDKRICKRDPIVAVNVDYADCAGNEVLIRNNSFSMDDCNTTAGVSSEKREANSSLKRSPNQILALFAKRPKTGAVVERNATTCCANIIEDSSWNARCSESHGDVLDNDKFHESLAVSDDKLNDDFMSKQIKLGITMGNENDVTCLPDVSSNEGESNTRNFIRVNDVYKRGVQIEQKLESHLPLNSFKYDIINPLTISKSTHPGSLFPYTGFEHPHCDASIFEQPMELSPVFEEKISASVEIVPTRQVSKYTGKVSYFLFNKLFYACILLLACIL